MKYSLNDYLPYINNNRTRLEIYPNNEVAAKLVSEYNGRGFEIIPFYRLIPTNQENVPNPASIIENILMLGNDINSKIVFVGIEAYLAFLNKSEQRDFFIGVRNLLEQQMLDAHFLISERFSTAFLQEWNPKYENAMQIVRFAGNFDDCYSLDIQLFPLRWVNTEIITKILVNAMQELGNYEPSGLHLFSASDIICFSYDYDYITPIQNANDALRILYSVDNTFDEEQADLLACECASNKCSPVQLLISRFGGESNITPEKAPTKLLELKDDWFWNLYIWLLRNRIKESTYLYQVLKKEITTDNFLQEYITEGAIRCLGEKNIQNLASERAAVLLKMKAVEPLITQFALRTINDSRAIPFLNCGKLSEIKALILHAASIDFMNVLPKEFEFANPLIGFYIAPFFEYGNKLLTEYFNKLRFFRIKGNIDRSFVEEAYNIEVPSDIEKRDAVLAKYEDGETALLVVDGLGAEFYPMLINMAERNNLYVENKQIVSANLPTSTGFNRINWDLQHKLPEVKQVDNISHAGYSKFENCSYEENLAQVLLLFQDTILTRVVEGLKNHKRVIVTADHGSSYLAVIAYKNKLAETLAWETEPDDWRYTEVPATMEATEKYEPIYHPSLGKNYFVVKGYNRLPKKGGKLYALHGGASLEERLVPFVVFTNEYTNNTVKQKEEQFVEDEIFDSL